MTTVGEVISRVRNLLKASKQDAFMTDRYIYSLIMKHGSLLMRRQDNLNRIMKFNSIFQSLNFVELEEVDKVPASCVNLTSGCNILRTKEMLPAMMEGYYGPLIRSVISLDYSVEIKPTYPTIYEKISKQKSFKYNKTKYYWYLDGRLYFPNINFNAVKIDGVFSGDISHFNCDVNERCKYIQNLRVPIPDFLFSEIEQFILREMGVSLNIPIDEQHDNKNINR